MDSTFNRVQSFQIFTNQNAHFLVYFVILQILCMFTYFGKVFTWKWGILTGVCDIHNHMNTTSLGEWSTTNEMSM